MTFKYAWSGGTAHQEMMYGLGTAYQVMWSCASGDVWSGDCISGDVGLSIR